MGNGVKVVGAAPIGHQEYVDDDAWMEDRIETKDAGRAARPDQPAPAPPRRRRGRFWVTVLAIVAVAGVAGTITFQRQWSSLNSQKVAEAQARQATSTFLVALTNFDAKSVDSDFSRLTAMATGTFAKQANEFFNSSIRQQLETALASSRGQIRNLYVQSVSGNQATVYAVVDQLYVNRSLTAPQSDVLRVVVQVNQINGSWKVSDVTVLEGPSLSSPSASTSSGSGS